MAVQLGKSDSHWSLSPLHYCSLTCCLVPANAEIPNQSNFVGYLWLILTKELAHWHALCLSVQDTNYKHHFQEGLCVQYDICFGYCSVCSCLVVFGFSFLRLNELWFQRKAKITHFTTIQWLKWTFSVRFLSKSFEDPTATILTCYSGLEVSCMRTSSALSCWMKLLSRLITQLTAFCYDTPFPFGL